MPNQALSVITPNCWWFMVGRNPILSEAELQALLPNTTIERNDSIVRIRFEKPLIEAPEELIKRLGGTVKIARELQKDCTEAVLLKTIEQELKATDGKAVFGLSWYKTSVEKTATTLKTLETWGKTIKHSLKEKGIAARYLENREPILSSVTVEKNNLLKRGKEFVFYEQPDGLFSVGVTLAVQPFEALSARDFGRPGRDDESGMLPPKLALMLINLTTAKPGATLLDPFCGSGTIVTEAARLGFGTIIGSDLSDKAVADTQKNLDWQQKNILLKNEQKIKIFQSDASELGQKIPSASVDAIATEPYLGKPLRGTETRGELEKQILDLKKIYLAAFAAFAKILKPGGVVVFIIPCFKNTTKNTTVEAWLRIDCLKEIKKLGFSIAPLLPTHEFILYARPYQRVGREIWRFVKNS